MCAIDPIFSFEVSQNRIDVAGRAIKNAREKLSKDQAFEVFFELGLGDAITFESTGGLELHLTDLQMVSVAAALSAVAECQGRKVERK